MGERPVGLTRDAGWQIGVSRTLPVTAEEAWDLLTSPGGLALWLGQGLSAPAKGARYRTADGTEGEFRSVRPGDRVRLTWRPRWREREAIVQVVLVATPTGCSVRFHSERLNSAAERERMREHWRDALDRIERALAGGPDENRPVRDRMGTELD